MTPFGQDAKIDILQWPKPRPGTTGRMTQTDDLLDVIEAIHSAGLEAARWPDAFHTLTTITGPRHMPGAFSMAMPVALVPEFSYNQAGALP